MTEASSATHGVAVAIIPARGGSKGLPGKNVMRVGGVPLVARAIAAARAARSVGLVVVTTDDDEIARVARDAGAVVVPRPAELAGDTASSESALLHALDDLLEDGGCDGVDGCDGTDGHPEASVTLFIQATSPFISPADLDAAVAQIATGERDSVFAAVPSHAFLWTDAPRGGAAGVNHDPAFRPRRQDRAAEYRETGAFYAMRTDGFRSARHRFFGRIGVQLVPELHAIEIDTAADLVVAQALANLIDGAAHGLDVDAVVTDFDGVHTDDTAIVGEAGVEFVRVSRSDGAGVARLREAGVPVLIISAETHPVVSARAAKLGVEVRQGVADKAAALHEWAAERGIPLDRVAYLGNDRGDLPALEIVGWPVAVADAIPDVRRVARIVLERAGGHGAVRELADAVLAGRAAHADRADHPGHSERAEGARPPIADHRVRPRIRP
ncbi:acylneuraminate cytidylyltransferase [Agromyces aerolatus]|uniref:acylneuraminate cytidylyltransferase n=1 Tax=Agromyces sp. LY-1074 TaxID=3074080 RepID=UPI002865B38C|nr:MULTISPECIES: acylneuraminate cytidylyltransferase [unclassified Agromyces]MDR5698263.1 acylneuraminate cytidylyltransferase [Agromyces sp. LY-1074]MDR5704557.1 acylneuraminate cytidylyltransferase [Agromyces sp. LY-1358]